MKITILGAGGNIGQRISKEAANRGYELSLITSKDKSFFGFENQENVTIQKEDIFETEALATAFQNSDVVISAYAPPHDNNGLLTPATNSLIAAAKKADVRLIAVGGAGSLQISETTQLVDSPEFPEEYKAVALAHREALENVYYKEEQLNWTNVSPSAYIYEGERTNEFRIGENSLIANEEGQSAISMEDFAVAIIDEVENKKFLKKRFTVGY